MIYLFSLLFGMPLGGPKKQGLGYVKGWDTPFVFP